MVEIYGVNLNLNVSCSLELIEVVDKRHPHLSFPVAFDCLCLKTLLKDFD